MLYDTPHLLKNIRNNLKKTGINSILFNLFNFKFVICYFSLGFSLNGIPVIWKYIVDLYEADKKSPIKLAPKLTFKHVNLPIFTNMSVKLAAQVLFHHILIYIFIKLIIVI